MPLLRHMISSSVWFDDHILKIYISDQKKIQNFRLANFK